MTVFFLKKVLNVANYTSVKEKKNKATEEFSSAKHTCKPKRRKEGIQPGKILPSAGEW